MIDLANEHVMKTAHHKGLRDLAVNQNLRSAGVRSALDGIRAAASTGLVLPHIGAAAIMAGRNSAKLGMMMNGTSHLSTTDTVPVTAIMQAYTRTLDAPPGTANPAGMKRIVRDILRPASLADSLNMAGKTASPMGLTGIRRLAGITSLAEHVMTLTGTMNPAEAMRLEGVLTLTDIMIPAEDIGLVITEWETALLGITAQTDKPKDHAGLAVPASQARLTSLQITPG